MEDFKSRETTIVTENEPIVNVVHEQAVLDHVIEKKNIEVHNKNVVTEIHEQPVIEIEKQKVETFVQEPSILETIQHQPKYEEINKGSKATYVQPAVETTFVKDTPTITNIQEGETVKEIITQPIIEHHTQPVITEVHEKKIIENIEQPIVRTIVEKPIIRETLHAPQAKQQYHYRQDSGMFQNIAHGRTLSRGTTIDLQQKELEKRVEQMSLEQSTVQEYNQDTLKMISYAGKNHLWGLSHGKELYHMRSTSNGMEWQFFPTQGRLFKDLGVSKGGTLFAIGDLDGYLYRLDASSVKMDLYVPGDTTRLRQVSPSSRTKIYALAEDGSVLYLNGDHWDPMVGKLKKISSGGKHFLRRTDVWGIDFSDKALRWDQKGQWELIGEELIDISVASDNAVYGIRKIDQQLVKWDGNKFVVQSPPSGSVVSHNGWKLSSISAYKDGNVYAVEAGTGNLLKLI